MSDLRVGVPNVWLETSLPREDLSSLMMLLFFLSSPWSSDPFLVASFPFLSNCAWIFHTPLVVWVSFCQSPVSFQWELFHMQMCFRCVHEGKWVLYLPTSLFFICVISLLFYFFKLYDNYFTIFWWFCHVSTWIHIRCLHKISYLLFFDIRFLPDYKIWEKYFCCNQ